VARGNNNKNHFMNKPTKILNQNWVLHSNQQTRKEKVSFSFLNTFFFLFICQIVNGQINLKKDYTNFYSPTIGTYQGITFREAGFSGMFPIEGSNGTEFWVCSDRGVNIDGANANAPSCRPTYDKIYAFPNYVPKIHRIRLIGDSVQILQTITIKRPNGAGSSGILNPTGFGSTAAEKASNDTVQDCMNFLSKITEKDTFGIDAEGLVVDKQGNFWLCEEGGVSIWKLNSNGVLISRYTPYATKAGAQTVDIAIDSVFSYRKNNRGFEGIALSPSGKIFAIIQSPILFPTKSVGEATRIHRILEIDPSTGAQKMYAYVNDGIIGPSGSNQIRMRDWKIGDMAAINDSTFLLLEAAIRGTSDFRRLYQINIVGATNVTSGLYNTNKTLEALIDSIGLASAGITPVKKTLVMDLLANSWPASLEKAEGLAIINDSTIAICNDNDYGVESPTENGVARATGINSHVLVYSLSGNNKLKNYIPVVTNISQGVTGFSSSKAPYLTATQAGASLTSIMTAGDKVNGYQLNGIPDGMGAIDLGNGTFNLYVAHEFTPTSGIVRAHGTKGAYISQLNIDKNSLAVRSGNDLIQNVKVWKNGQYVTSNAANVDSINGIFSRFCSGEIPAASAFYNNVTGKGSLARMFMNGEETGSEGRAFAHILTGAETGTSYQLPYLGRFSWENAVASPYSSDLTVVAGMDDAPPGQVYFYVGAKSDSGNEIEKAGLAFGKLYGVAVSGLATETSSLISPNTAFSLVDLGYVRDSSGAALEIKSTALGVTRFLRPEDGLFDPANPNDFYFVTTNSMNGPSRMYRLRFNNINDVTLGGTITAVIDGTEGPKMMDNIGSDRAGHIYIQEDPGNNDHIAKVWQYNIATDSLFEIARFDSTYFISGKSDFLTIDEESSGIFDAQDILGPGKFIMNAQIHKSVGGEMVELGQLLVLNSPDAAASNPEIGVFGNNIEINTKNNIKEPNFGDSTLFNQQSLNTKSIRNFSIRNSGQSPLTISGVSFVGNSYDFTLLNLPTFPISVNAGSSLNFVVQYRPIIRTNSTAMVKIQSNDFDESTSIFRISGTACSGAPINNIASISGLSNVCLKKGTPDTVYYSISENVTATGYAWTLPVGVTMVSGNGTSRIGVTFGNNFISNSQIRVKPLNACGQSTRFSIITLFATPPTSVPVFTTSTLSACAIRGTATNATYTINAIAGANSYLWTVPAGATIVSGQGTTSIDVNFAAGFTGGVISVAGVSNCGNTPSKSITISLLEKPVVSGPASICPGDQETYSVPAVAGATRYRFNLPAGLALVSQTGNSAVISNNGAFASGKIGINVFTNTCGVSQPGTISVNTAACRNMNDLSVAIYPNPSNGQFKVRFSTATEGSLEILDLTGKVVYAKNFNTNVEAVNANFLQNGIYLVKVSANGITQVSKISIAK
jgi:hypothetical protein